VRVNLHGGEGNSYGKRGEFLQPISGQQGSAECWILEATIVGMCGSCWGYKCMNKKVVRLVE
jgi:hypothetical protein